jgi:D-sedoheptulose 7-phosphate isomerase
MKPEIQKQFKEHLYVIQNNLHLLEKIEATAKLIIKTVQQGNKVLVCGNGGSAADAQHIAAELVGKYERKGRPLSAIALTTDTSLLTAWSNDDSFETVFERQVEALGKKGDVLIGVSTSGNSQNIILALKKAKELGMTTVSFLGGDGGKQKGLADVELIVNSNRTSRIQECHELIYHIICNLVEQAVR